MQDTQNFLEQDEQMHEQNQQSQLNKKPKGSPAYHRATQQDAIDAIESTEFFQTDAYDRLEQYEYLERKSNEEIKENMQRQKEIEERLKEIEKENSNQNTSSQNNDYNGNDYNNNDYENEYVEFFDDDNISFDEENISHLQNNSQDNSNNNSQNNANNDNATNKNNQNNTKNTNNNANQQNQDSFNENNIKREDPLKEKKALEAELKQLKNREKDIRNRIDEAKAEVTDALVAAIKAKDIGELIRALIKAYNAWKQKRALKGKLGIQLDERKLVKSQLKKLKKFHKIAKDIERLSSEPENRDFLRSMSLTLVKARRGAKHYLGSLNQAKTYYKRFESYFKNLNSNDAKVQANAKGSIEKLFKEVMKKMPEYQNLYKKQFEKIQNFLNPQKNKENTQNFSQNKQNKHNKKQNNNNYQGSKMAM